MGAPHHILFNLDSPEKRQARLAKRWEYIGHNAPGYEKLEAFKAVAFVQQCEQEGRRVPADKDYRLLPRNQRRRTERWAAKHVARVTKMVALEERGGKSSKNTSRALASDPQPHYRPIYPTSKYISQYVHQWHAATKKHGG